MNRAVLRGAVVFHRPWLLAIDSAAMNANGSLVEAHEPETHLIPLAIDAAVGKGPPIEIYGEDYPRRDVHPRLCPRVRSG